MAGFIPGRPDADPMEKLPCPNCGAEVNPDWAFCQECGAELDEEALKEALPHCPDCGETIRAGEDLIERSFGPTVGAQPSMWLCPHCRAVLGVGVYG
jgi:predicted RNA-binding Zn-ribbon protein involved in translation (DUF1610 family)